MRGARRLTYPDSRMKNLLITLLDFAVVTAKLCGPGGVRAVIVENLLLKQQLIVDERVPVCARVSVCAIARPAPLNG